MTLKEQFAMRSPLEAFHNEITGLKPAHPVGRIVAAKGSLVSISGLVGLAKVGDRLRADRQDGSSILGDVLTIDQTLVHMITDQTAAGLTINDRVILLPADNFRPGKHWLGRIIDPNGHPMDGKPLLQGVQAHDLTASAPQAVDRQPFGDRLETGLCVLNTILPVVEGQRIGLFAGSGVGKSRLLGTLARNMQADVVVIALIGERGREVNDFANQVMGIEGMQRSVVIAATSDQSALTRRRCASSAMTVAEHFRDQGKSVLLLADSITRFAEAHREIAATAGETPSLRGYPPSTTPLITSLCERAGPGSADQGYITAVFSVLVAGSDMDEPIADIVRGVLDGHIVLNREIAERGRFPAIDVRKSVSRCLPDAASKSENRLISEVRSALATYEASEIMLKSGLYAEGADPSLDRAAKLWPELDSFFATNDSNGIQHSFDRLGLIMRRG
jgi:flagellum-specific ATP synthase